MSGAIGLNGNWDPRSIIDGAVKLKIGAELLFNFYCLFTLAKDKFDLRKKDKRKRKCAKQHADVELKNEVFKNEREC